MAELLQWCMELQVSPGRVIVISNIPKGLSAEAIQDLLRGPSRCLRLCQVRGVRPDGRGDYQMAVCELTTAVDALHVPRMLEVTDKEVWAVTLVGGGLVPHPDSGGESEEPPSRGAEDPVPAAPGESEVGSRAPDPEWAKALGKALKEALQPSPESVAYKRLHIFSEKDPLSRGEETFEAWHSHVTETLASWAVSEEEKRRQLLESLRDPAFEVVQMIKQENSNISVLQCLELLSSVFGKSVQAEALFLEFNKTYQQKGETASAYIL
ncbi:modulator of apoptosis 1-like [Alligator mississippiensis]|uniref:modulator of apoptosis 1-like n=1 Tax=Alligator mississippiensis TaxID=8496 RepID=UPI002877F517|nr:modulator of apoptosis 1-like [Alligator mississippiensis]